MTLLLSRSALLAVLEPDACLDALRSAFLAADPEGPAGQRVFGELPFAGVATALIPGLLPGIDAYTVKVNAKFPGAQPAQRGVICLHSGTDGSMLALLDSATITAWRTGLAAALAMDALAAPGGRLGVIGAGAQAELTLLGLGRLRDWPALTVHDTDPAHAASFAARHGGTVAASPSAVSAVSDLVLCATWSRTPLLSLADTHPGQHVTTLGADEPGKLELSPDLLAAAALTVDHLPLARSSGILTDPALHATPLAVHLRDASPVRPSLSVYAPVGLPWQDLALSWFAYRRATSAGLGAELDFLERSQVGGGVGGMNTRFRLRPGVV
ncbi:ornithine cyclodeaminase/alanine dehydrogenase-like protein (mu-crystallin family) [Streptacidiphilus sp. MAP12-20]|uniref:ornithine cyclodeaminase family protein n=1 Tax=Streptacidiphilus sp. MAP12-20 TaxID=3156299 RepID=UPI003513BCDE